MWHGTVGQGPSGGQEALWARLAYARRVAAFQTKIPSHVHSSWGRAHGALLSPLQKPVVEKEWDVASQQSFFFQLGLTQIFFATLDHGSFIKVCQQVFLWICRTDAHSLVMGKYLKILSGYFPAAVMDHFVSLAPIDTHAFLENKAFVLPLPTVLTEQDVLSFVYGFLYIWMSETLTKDFVHRLSLRFPKGAVQNTYYQNLFAQWPVQTREDCVDNILLYICRDYAVVRRSKTP